MRNAEDGRASAGENRSSRSRDAGDSPPEHGAGAGTWRVAAWFSLVPPAAGRRLAGQGPFGASARRREPDRSRWLPEPDCRSAAHQSSAKALPKKSLPPRTRPGRAHRLIPAPSAPRQLTASQGAAPRGAHRPKTDPAAHWLPDPDRPSAPHQLPDSQSAAPREGLSPRLPGHAVRPIRAGPLAPSPSACQPKCRPERALAAGNPIRPSRFPSPGRPSARRPADVRRTGGIPPRSREPGRLPAD
ncbi:hypothetical protein ATK30_7588 [Amycolatopsis echigonensis]|uniref:Uncharacterized protein n=1 Tax=Amycolatopsis echigonensis TaxID=2576905 RepID=A0A2N3WS16_9PSEU|nr:hypothetical protein ATK30_7588 [Amycolatopsis niigatensis]